MINIERVHILRFKIFCNGLLLPVFALQIASTRSLTPLPGRFGKVDIPKYYQWVKHSPPGRSRDLVFLLTSAPGRSIPPSK